jgi:hypothetical protein
VQDPIEGTGELERFGDIALEKTETRVTFEMRDIFGPARGQTVGAAQMAADESSCAGQEGPCGQSPKHSRSVASATPHRPANYGNANATNSAA